MRRPDELAVEEPLEIRLAGSAGQEGRASALTLTMRTPGHDFELALGWALAEGVIVGPGDVGSVRYCTDSDIDGEQRYNVVTVSLSAAGAAGLAARGGPVARLAVTSSSCGVCGTASIRALSERGFAGCSSPVDFALEDVLGWPELLRSEGQKGFAVTGGLHAAGLVSTRGELLAAREDIGRHNAVDKVIGWAIREALEGRLEFPLGDLGLVVSGRTSFEIVQKALAAGIPVVSAVSAASSLAARLAEDHGLTLIGFVRQDSCTVYSHPERLTGSMCQGT
ncbi:MAG: formate dehydrogenase accessory sulfurtransferase FdhD [Acidimicrobiales bacterium]